MVILDANLLIYAEDATSPFHDAALAWLDDQLNGRQRVGLPWPTSLAFLRVSTNPRVTAAPLSIEEAWSRVREWLELEIVWIPAPMQEHAAILGDLVSGQQITGNLVPDAHLAALAIEHGLELLSADSDFARFPGLRWRNPLRS